MRTPLEMRFCVSLPESGQRPATSATYRRVGDGTAHRATGGRGRGRSTTGPGREKRDGERGRCGVRGSSVQQTGCRTHGTNQRGQTIAEMGLIVVLSILIVLGIIEFGYAFMALNLVPQATSAGARAATGLQVGSRGTCGLVTYSLVVDATNGLEALELA